MKKNSSGGVGILGVLQIIFIVLKCISVIPWSWWVVLTPIWIDLGLTVFLIFLMLICH